MRPGAWVVMDALPRTSNGKLHRAALPRPEQHPCSRRDPSPHPGRVSKKHSPASAADVLGVRAVGLDDNFFDLGGDSILLLQVLARLRSQGLECPARAIVEHETIARVAPHVTFVGAALAPPIRQHSQDNHAARTNSAMVLRAAAG